MIFDVDLRIAHNLAEDVFPGQTVRVSFCPSPSGWFGVVVGDDRSADLLHTATVATLELAVGTLIDLLRDGLRARYAAE